MSAGGLQLRLTRDGDRHEGKLHLAQQAAFKHSYVDSMLWHIINYSLVTDFFSNAQCFVF